VNLKKEQKELNSETTGHLSGNHKAPGSPISKRVIVTTGEKGKVEELELCTCRAQSTTTSKRPCSEGGSHEKEVAFPNTPGVESANRNGVYVGAGRSIARAAGTITRMGSLIVNKVEASELRKSKRDSTGTLAERGAGGIRNHWNAHTKKCESRTRSYIHRFTNKRRRQNFHEE